MVGDEAVERAGADVEAVLAFLEEEEEDGELGVAVSLTGGGIFVEGSQDRQPVEARPDQVGACWPGDEVLRSDGPWSLKAEEWEGEAAEAPRG